MTIQILLSVGLLLILVYGLAQRTATRLFSWLLMATATGGIYLVWFPDHATVLAGWLGVGRGTDLVVYCWILISFFLIVNLHIKHRHTLRMLTELTRQLALQQPRFPLGHEQDREPDPQEP